MPQVGTYDVALVIAGLATLTAVVLSLHLIHAHLKMYVKPQRQRYVIRILWMVPIYALDSFLSLCFIGAAPVFEVPRDAYEAYVLYNFVALMIDCMGGEMDARTFFATQPPQKHWFPFGFLGEHDMSVFLETTRLCVLQYSVIRPLSALVSLGFYFSENVGYDDQDLSVTSSYLWIMLLNNASVTLALYYLIYFYHAALPCEALQRTRPLSKFLAVKSVVFFCFWQYTAIALLGAFGVIDRSLAHKSSAATQTGLTDFIVCLEMAFFAAVHFFVFPPKEHLLWAPTTTTTTLRGASSGKTTTESALHAQLPHKSTPPAMSSLNRTRRTDLGDGNAMAFDDALRDMFFVGDVVADLGRVCRECPGVLSLGFSQVNAARKNRQTKRRQKREDRIRRKQAAKDSADLDDDDAGFELPPGHRPAADGDAPPPWGEIPPAPSAAPQRQDSPALEKWWNTV